MVNLYNPAITRNCIFCLLSYHSMQIHTTNDLIHNLLYPMKWIQIGA